SRPGPDSKNAWDMTDQILRALAREVWGHGGRLMVAYIPSRMEVSDRDWQLTRLRYGLSEERWDRGAVLSRLNAIARDARVPLLDLTPALKHAAGPLKQPYYEYDSHSNALGHRVAAAELRGALTREGWLPACVGRRDTRH